VRLTPYLQIHLQLTYTFSRLAIQTSFFCHCKYFTARIISTCMPKQTQYVTVQHVRVRACVCVCERERESVSSSNQLTNHLTRYSFNIHFNIIVPSTPPSPKWSHISWLSKSNFPINSSRRPNVLHTCSNTHSAERAPPHFIVVMVLCEGQAL